jgi:methylated-DNA-[protein]-cysteine S-methyltransferase
LDRRSFFSKIGWLSIWANSNGICAIHFKRSGSTVQTKTNRWLDKAQIQIEEYLNRKRKRFSLPLSQAGTLFQKKVWRAAQKIPYGSMWSYQKLALGIGHQNAARAVGSALRKNPVPIVVPCHRVISKDGRLGGYAQGPKRKAWLLRREK